VGGARHHPVSVWDIWLFFFVIGLMGIVLGVWFYR